MSRAILQKNLKEFNKEVQDFRETLEEDIIPVFIRRIALDALTRVVKRTPVDTGRTRGNWQVTLNVPAVGAVSKKDKAGATTIAGGSAVLGKISAAIASGSFPIIWIVNNVEWIEVLEYGGFVPKNPGPSKKKGTGGKDIPGRTGKVLVEGGFSVQSPHGMVNVTITELRSMFT